MPIVWGMTALQHFPKDSISICITLISSLRFFIIDSSEKNYFTLLMRSKKQSVLLKKIGSKPVFVIVSQRSSLSILTTSWILRNNIKG